MKGFPLQTDPWVEAGIPLLILVGAWYFFYCLEWHSDESNTQFWFKVPGLLAFGGCLVFIGGCIIYAMGRAIFAALRYVFFG